MKTSLFNNNIEDNFVHKNVYAVILNMHFKSNKETQMEHAVTKHLGLNN